MFISGILLNIVIKWIKIQADPDKSNYLYRIGVSLIDAGAIKFHKFSLYPADRFRRLLNWYRVNIPAILILTGP
jgi:hypothetical protein